MIYFVNFQDNNLGNINVVNDVLNKCVKNSNLNYIDNTCQSIKSLKTESVSCTNLYMLIQNYNQRTVILSMNVQNDIVSITFLLLLGGRGSKKAKNLEFKVVFDRPLI